ncbi:OsmC family peroxiredoxin [Entomomonas asaccharolytica]|uniref:OsmC family peroxiredoxin n=1 Tax=Entomomonas asaccharolytica TaxID=2785331 RepID=A0A974NFQ9_9GAMM|nr:OsmC family peroxiredoxin [Entomomonas asaccharolytica]QQP85750.1 OsmC family peroxiredoxin [Entomomonas asaccharolytica]
MKRLARTEWVGSLDEGVSVITTDSQVLNEATHSYSARYQENTPNQTSPEELIAAAHSDCYSSMFKIVFEKENYDVQNLKTCVEVTIDDETHDVIGSDISVVAKIPNISKEKFISLATLAKDICPVTRLLKIPVSLDCELIE